jgi:hypothetical protein
MKTEYKVKLAEKGTLLAGFQEARTRLTSEMLDNPDEYGIYQTTRFYAQLDSYFELALDKQRGEIVEEIEKTFDWKYRGIRQVESFKDEIINKIREM